jgi:hypothetical protein
MMCLHHKQALLELCVYIVHQYYLCTFFMVLVPALLNVCYIRKNYDQDHASSGNIMMLFDFMYCHTMRNLIKKKHKLSFECK